MSLVASWPKVISCLFVIFAELEEGSTELVIRDDGSRSGSPAMTTASDDLPPESPPSDLLTVDEEGKGQCYFGFSLLSF